MFPKADFVAREVDAPFRHWCKSGHVAPATFQRNGPKAPAEPTKFFAVSSDAHPGTNGTYCEPCLIIANAMRRGDLQFVSKMR